MFETFHHLKENIMTLAGLKYVKHLLILAALAVSWMNEGGVSSSIETGQLVIMGFTLAGWIISIIAVATILRARVNELSAWQKEQDKWKDSHDAIHEKQTEILARLDTVAIINQQRITRLEAVEDRRATEERKRRSSD